MKKVSRSPDHRFPKESGCVNERYSSLSYAERIDLSIVDIAESLPSGTSVLPMHVAWRLASVGYRTLGSLRLSDDELQQCGIHPMSFTMFLSMLGISRRKDGALCERGKEDELPPTASRSKAVQQSVHSTKREIRDIFLPPDEKGLRYDKDHSVVCMEDGTLGLVLKNIWDVGGSVALVSGDALKNAVKKAHINSIGVAYPPRGPFAKVYALSEVEQLPVVQQALRGRSLAAVLGISENGRKKQK